MAVQVTVNGVTIKQDEAVFSVSINGKRAEIRETIDLLDVDGEPKFIYRNFCTYGVKPVDRASLAKGVKPTTKFISLASGIYVPTKYISDSTMKELEELEGEYSARLMVYKIQCQGSTDPVCAELYADLYSIEKRQAELAVKELEANGFSFSVKHSLRYPNILIEVKGPDKSVGYYETADLFGTDIQPYVLRDCYKGKWSLLGPTVYSLIKFETRDMKLEVSHVDEAEYIETCTAALVKVAGNPEFNCGYGIVKPLLPIDDVVHDYYIAATRNVHGIQFVLDYTPLHTIETEEMKVSGPDGKTYRRIVKLCKSGRRHVFAEAWV
mgnify:FL=1